MSSIDDYRRLMLAAKAERDGVSIDELQRRSERHRQATLRAHELWSNRLSAWGTLATHAATMPGRWMIFSVVR